MREEENPDNYDVDNEDHSLMSFHSSQVEPDIAIVNEFEQIRKVSIQYILWVLGNHNDIVFIYRVLLTNHLSEELLVIHVHKSSFQITCTCIV